MTAYETFVFLPLVVVCVVIRIFRARHASRGRRYIGRTQICGAGDRPGADVRARRSARHRRLAVDVALARCLHLCRRRRRDGVCAMTPPLDLEALRRMATNDDHEDDCASQPDGFQLRLECDCMRKHVLPLIDECERLRAERDGLKTIIEVAGTEQLIADGIAMREQRDSARAEASRLRGLLSECRDLIDEHADTYRVGMERNLQPRIDTALAAESKEHDHG